jgi:hypothetical protein
MDRFLLPLAPRRRFSPRYEVLSQGGGTFTQAMPPAFAA